jgi:DNA modification methylase
MATRKPRFLGSTVVRVDRLKPHPRNYRGHPEEQLAHITASLIEHGQYRSIVVARDYTILAGHGVWLGAQRAEWEDVSIVKMNIAPDSAQGLKILALDNELPRLAVDDDVALLGILQEIAAHDPLEGLLGTGWDDVDLTQFVRDVNASIVGPKDKDVAPKVPTKRRTISRLGDVWECGEHRVVCGDCTDPAAVTTGLGGDLADMVWTDPPYGVSYVGKTAEALTIESDEDTSILAPAFDVVLQAGRPGAAVYVAAPAGPQGRDFVNLLAERGLFRQRLVWVKNRMVLGHSDYHYRHEDIYYGFIPGAKGRRGRGGAGWFGDSAQTTVFEIDRPSASEDHPTMKPVELVERCIVNSSAPGAVVLDLFGGSGTTMIAAHSTGRRAVLIEKDPRYVDVAVRRWAELSGLSGRRISDQRKINA